MTLETMFQEMARLKKGEPLFTLGNGKTIPVSRAVVMCSQATIQAANLTKGSVVELPIGVSLMLSDVVPYGRVYIMDRKFISGFDPPCISDPDAAYTVNCEGLTERKVELDNTPDEGIAGC